MEKKVNGLKCTSAKKSTDTAKDSLCGGIDTLDFSEILETEKEEHGESDKEDTEPTEPSDPFKGEDPTSKITCEMIY